MIKRPTLSVWQVASTVHNHFNRIGGTDEGWCAIASFHLKDVLELCGHTASVMMYWDVDDSLAHCWVECRGYVIDLTADQFGQGPIFMEKKRKVSKRLRFTYRKNGRGTMFKKVTRKTLDTVGWREDQKPLDIDPKKLYIDVDGNIELLSRTVANLYKGWRI